MFQVAPNLKFTQIYPDLGYGVVHPYLALCVMQSNVGPSASLWLSHNIHDTHLKESISKTQMKRLLRQRKWPKNAYKAKCSDNKVTHFQHN